MDIFRHMTVTADLVVNKPADEDERDENEKETETEESE